MLACGALAQQANGDGDMRVRSGTELDSERQRQQIVAQPPGRRWGSSRRTAGRTQALASDQEESPEARQRGYRQVDIGSRWLPKKMVPAGFLGASGCVGTTRSMT